MANRRHVALLRRSVPEWNLWRASHPRVSPNFEGASLRALDLTGADLAGADLSGAANLGARARISRPAASTACLLGACNWLSRQSLPRSC